MRRYHQTALTGEERRYERQLIRYEGLSAQGVNLPVPKAPSPVIVAKPRPPGALIGHDLKTDEDVYLSAENLTGGLLILGKNGTGKTVTIRHLAGQDMDEDRAVIVLDPHGDLTDDLLLRVPPHRTDDVVLLDVAHPTHAFGINPFWCSDPTNEELVARRGDEIHDTMKTIWADNWGFFLDDLIPNAAYVLLSHQGYSMVDLPRLFTDSAFRASLMHHVPAVVRDFWENEYDVRSDAGQRTQFRSTLSRVRKFIRNPRLRQILGQVTPTVDFGTLMAEKKIVFVKMSVKDLGDDNVALLGALILRQILNAAFERLNLPLGERHQVMLYADEYQRFATADFGTLIEEARKAGLTPVLAHQNRDQLDSKLRQAPFGARSIICLQVSSKDAHDLVEELDAQPRTPTQPVAEPLTYIKRNGHPTPFVVTLVHDLEEMLEFALARYAAYAAGYRSGGGASPWLHAVKLRITNQSNAILTAAMRNEPVESTATLDATLSLLSDSHLDDFYTLDLMLLASFLRAAPVYDPRTQTSSSQVREQLRTTLTHLEPLTAYTKLQDDGTIVERLIRINLPPAIPWSEELQEQQARIHDNFRTRYGRPRKAVDDAIEQRSASAPQRSNEVPSTTRWEEVESVS